MCLGGPTSQAGRAGSIPVTGSTPEVAGEGPLPACGFRVVGVTDTAREPILAHLPLGGVTDISGSILPPRAHEAELTDHALVLASVAEPEHFAQIFDRHAAAIHRYLSRRVGDFADDLLSETFLTAFPDGVTTDPNGLTSAPGSMASPRTSCGTTSVRKRPATELLPVSQHMTALKWRTGQRTSTTSCAGWTALGSGPCWLARWQSWILEIARSCCCTRGQT